MKSMIGTSFIFVIVLAKANLLAKVAAETNAKNPESLVEDKVSNTMTFPNLTLNDGDPYCLYCECRKFCP